MDSNTQRIPKKIHYFWLGGSPLPEKTLKCIESWKKYCPDYEIIQWNESNYDYKKNEYMYEAYQAKKYGFAPDYGRLDIMYTYGGIYLDTDVEIIKPLDELLINDAFMGFENNEVAPGLMIGARPGIHELKEAMEIYDKIKFKNSDGTLNLTPSPIYMTNYLKEKGLKDDGTLQKVGNITIYPKEYFNPKDMLTGSLQITDNTYSIHHFDASWWGEKERKEFETQKKLREKSIWLWRIYNGINVYKKAGIFSLIHKIKNMKSNNRHRE